MKITFNAPLTIGFAIVATISLVLNELTGGMINHTFGLYYTSLFDPMMVIRLFTYPFMHGSLNHLMSNLMLFLVLGPVLESKYGIKKLLFAMGFTSVVAGVIHLLFIKNTMLVGCSGIVFMFIILASFAGSTKGIPVTFILVFILYIGGQLINAFTANNISELTHILGAICGAFIGYKMQ